MALTRRPRLTPILRRGERLRRYAKRWSADAASGRLSMRCDNLTTTRKEISFPSSSSATILPNAVLQTLSGFDILDRTCTAGAREKYHYRILLLCSVLYLQHVYILITEVLFPLAHYRKFKFR